MSSPSLAIIDYFFVSSSLSSPVHGLLFNRAGLTPGLANFLAQPHGFSRHKCILPVHYIFAI